MNTLFIIAGTYQQAFDFAKEMGVHRKRWRYVQNPSVLRGYRNCPIVYVGTWWNRRDLVEINMYTQSHGFIEITTAEARLYSR